MEQSSPWEANS